jgi:hypothetical protein
LVHLFTHNRIILPEVTDYEITQLFGECSTAFRR